MDQFSEARKTEFDDDLPGILGGMSVRAEDGLPGADSIRYQWFEYLPLATEISPEEGFAIMERYWRDWIAIGEAEPRDISRMLEMVEASKDVFWQQWLQIVDEVRST